MSDCQAEDAVTVGIPGVDGLPGDDHVELIGCGQPATRTVTWRDESDDHHHRWTDTVCDEHAESLLFAAECSGGCMTVLSDDPISA